MIGDLTKSRLSSISQQSNQFEGAHKTLHALLDVYYQLYVIDLLQVPSQPKKEIKQLSQLVQQKMPFPINQSLMFKQSSVSRLSQRQFNYIKQLNQSQQYISSSRILSPQQLTQRIKQKLQSNNKTAATQTVQSANKQSKIKYSFNSELDETAESNLSISDILSKLNEFDQERTEIKFQIYSEQSSKVDGLYLKWTNLHQKMKQALEIYINKIGNGKSLLQLYNDLDVLKNSKKVVEGYTQKQLLLKLDIYIQSLFLDERQILLYRSTSEKSRSIRTNNKGIRKMLIYN